MESLESLARVYIYIYIGYILNNVVARNCDVFNMLKKRNLKINCTPFTVIF